MMLMLCRSSHDADVAQSWNQEASYDFTLFLLVYSTGTAGLYLFILRLSIHHF